ncbi:MAG: hypothetical protein H0U81_04900, partial [Pyrinomonadaceae bacterium]|nr:hypothetical protein [Pyrinomonadaceae bacterium]
MRPRLQILCLLLTSLFFFGCVLDGSRTNYKSEEAAKPCAAESSHTDATRRQVDTQYSRQVAYRSADESLNRLQEYFRPALESNAKNFIGRSGAVKGFGAGAAYPQIWLRDSAT